MKQKPAADSLGNEAKHIRDRVEVAFITAVDEEYENMQSRAEVPLPVISK